MKKLFFITLITSLPSFAHDDHGPALKKATKKAIEGMSKVNTPLIKQPDCLTPPVAGKKTCAEVSDNFCAKLWNDQNKGNLKVFDGVIKAGKSTKSDFSLTVLENDIALVESGPNMPSDMQKIFRPLLKKLKDHLNKENSTTKWTRDYSQVKQEISNAVEDLADQRFNKKYAPATSKEYKKWTLQENLAYKKIQSDVLSEITMAQYKKHPNWLRIENIFPQAQKELMQSIDALAIDKDYKEELKTKVASVKLSLPLRDPQTIDASAECASTEINAFYYSTTNHFTVCAGFFNRYQSESALVTTISHELAHAIDSENKARIDWRKKSPVAQSLNKLLDSKNQTYKCDEWNKITKNINDKKDFNIVSTPMDKLYSCLRGEKELEEMTAENVLNASKQFTRARMGVYADANMFSRLVEVEKLKNDVMTANPTYYRPDLLGAEDVGYFSEGHYKDAEPHEIFMQNFYCALEEKDLTKDSFVKANKQLKEEIFDKAIGQTSKLYEARWFDYFQKINGLI